MSSRSNPARRPVPLASDVVVVLTSAPAIPRRCGPSNWLPARLVSVTVCKKTRTPCKSTGSAGTERAGSERTNQREQPCPTPSTASTPATPPIVIVSSDTHAGLQVEEYRRYLDSKFHPQFDEWVIERHNHRRLVEEVNGEYVAKWEGENAEGLRGAFDPVVRDKAMDADGVAGGDHLRRR